MNDNKEKYIQRIESCGAPLWKDKGPSLTMLDMELTERCDNNCIHCYINLPADDVVAKQKELSTSVVKSILEEALKVLTSNHEAYLKEMQGFCSRFLGPPGPRLLSCRSGADDVCVDAYGRFQPCMLLRHPDMIYDLKKGSLKDAITNFFPKIREVEATNPSYLAHCAKCFLMGLCEQCAAKSWMEHGTLDTPVEYLCEVAHIQVRYLGLLEEGEKAWQVENWKERLGLLSSGERA